MLAERGHLEAAAYVRDQGNADEVYEEFIDPMISDIARKFRQP